MTENITTIVENVEGQMDLITGDVVEVEETVGEISVDEIVKELVTTAFGGNTTITAYKIATIVNGVFKVTGTDKQIPPQMMYNYSRNGMIVKGVKGAKTFNEAEVTAFVTKYVNKYI
jgi:DUF4097 and DUF4098 domain-containing protein YvlB